MNIEASKIRVPASPLFRPLYNLPPNTDMVIMIGGRGGSKTYEASRFGAVEVTIKGRRVAVLRDEKESIRESILHEILTRYDSANKYGHFDSVFEKLDTGIKDKRTGNMVLFTKGFRASSNEKRTNLKGVSDTDTAIIEEAEDIRDFNKFSTFKDSIRTKQRLIVVILNTPDIQHWIVRRYFNLDPITFEDVPELAGKVREIDIDGYWKLIPKALPGFFCIQSNYKDNLYLPENVIRDYEGYGDPSNHTYDLHYYLTAIKGFASSGRKGQVLRKVKRISLAEYLKLDAKEIYGLDFGTARPAGMVGVKFIGNNCYARQLNYKPSDPLSLLRLFGTLQLHPSDDLVIADSAEPHSIGKLRRGFEANELEPGEVAKGYYVRGAIKGPGSVTYGLGLMNKLQLYAVDESTDLWDEINNYVYAKNKEDELTNDPEDRFNHLIDPWRYVVSARGRLF